MRVIFIGASKFGLRSLQKLQSVTKCKIVGIVTAPPEFSIEYKSTGTTRVTNVLHADFGAEAVRSGQSVWTLTGKMSDPDLHAWIRERSPELFVVVGWYHLIPRTFREIAPAVGLHASLLPDYSGGAPLVWAIINGEEKTGITLFRMDDGIDSGDIIGQHEEAIRPDDTIATLYARVEDAGLMLLETHIPRIASGEASYTPQAHELRRVVPQRRPEDGRIDWSWSAKRIYDFVRAQTKPYPGAFSFLGSSKVTIWSARLLCVATTRAAADASAGGNILEITGEGFIVSTGKSGENLLVTRVGAPDSEDISAVEFASRHKIAPGREQFG